MENLRKNTLGTTNYKHKFETKPTQGVQLFKKKTV